MQRKFSFFWIILAFCSCVKEEQPTRTDENLFKNLSTGQWSISFFEVDGVSLSGDFEGFNFVFFPNGQMEAYRGTQLVDQGDWSTKVDAGRIKLQLSSSRFDELNGEWFQVLIRISEIKLGKDVANSDAELILTRI